MRSSIPRVSLFQTLLMSQALPSLRVSLNKASYQARFIVQVIKPAFKWFGVLVDDARAVGEDQLRELVFNRLITQLNSMAFAPPYRGGKRPHPLMPKSLQNIIHLIPNRGVLGQSGFSGHSGSPHRNCSRSQTNRWGRAAVNWVRCQLPSQGSHHICHPFGGCNSSPPGYTRRVP